MFTESAGALAGVVGALLGWPPDRFWHATPGELAAVLTALAGPQVAAADAATMTAMMEAFPDG